MANLRERARKALASSATAVRTVSIGTALTVMPAMTAWATETGDTGIKVNFDTTQMFTFANIIIESLMPVVYITAGLGIGFLIINSLKNAFH